MQKYDNIFLRVNTNNITDKPELGYFNKSNISSVAKSVYEICISAKQLNVAKIHAFLRNRNFVLYNRTLWTDMQDLRTHNIIAYTP